MIIVLSSFASANVLFNDSFNRTTGNDLGNSWVEIEGTTGSVRIEFNRYVTSLDSSVAALFANHAGIRDFTNGSGTPTHWSFLYQGAADISTGNKFAYSLINGTTPVIYLYTNTDGTNANLYYNDTNGGTLLTTLTPAQDIIINITSIDFNTHTFSVSIDGGDNGSSLGFLNNLDTVDAVIFSSFSGEGHSIQIDDLLIFEKPRPDTTPPTLSDVVLLSTIDGREDENITLDSTPSFYLNCIDDGSCDNVRIGNNSGDTFDTAGLNRNCTFVSGNNWTCTLATNDQLTNPDVPQTIGFWGLDDNGNNHTVWNVTINVTYIIDTQEPSFSNESTNASSLLTGNSFQFNITIEDDYELDWYAFSWNCSSSGIWNNNSNGSLSGTPSLLVINRTTGLSFGTCGYRWYANDTSGNMNTSLLRTFTIVSPNLYLNSIEANRTYEYETTVNISTNLNFIDILDDTNRYINQLSPFNYSIDLLRINKFNDTNTSNNISSGSQTAVNINNKTDLYNASINLTGLNSPKNITLNYTNILNFPGILLGNNLYQNLFIYSGVRTDKINLSFTTAGSKTIYINYSNQGNPLDRNGTLNFTINAFSLDGNNKFSYNASFNETKGYRHINGSFPFEIANFESNDTKSNWDIINNTGTDTWATEEFRDGGTENAYYYAFSSYSNLPGGQCNVIKNWKLTRTYNEEELMDLRNISYAKMNYSYSFVWSLSFGSNTAEYFFYIRISDGSKTVNLKTYSEFQSGEAAGSSSDNPLLELYREGNNFNVYIDGSFDSTVSLATLDSNEEWIFDFYDSFAVNTPDGSPCKIDASHTTKVYTIKLGGFGLNKTSGVFDKGNVEIISNVINETIDDIAAATLTASDYKPTGTKIDYYLTADNSTWETVTNGDRHTFVATGKKLAWKALGNSSVNDTSFLIRDVKVEIIPTVMSSLEISINNRIVNSYNFELNGSSTPVYYNGTDRQINLYINSSGQTSDVLIPVTFIAGSGGVLEISNLNLTENINPVRLNTTAIQSLNSIPFKLTYTDGTVQVNDLRFDFRGSKNITVYAHNADYSSSLNRTIFVKYSPFNLSLIVDYFEVFYSSRNQSNVEPYGQNDSHGIFQIASLAYDGNIDIYSRYNNSPHSCLTTQEFRGQNFTVSSLTNISTLNITNLTTSNQILVSDLNNSAVGNIRAYSMVNCSAFTFPFIPFTYFCFNSMDSEAVKTQDWQDDCQVMV